MPRKHSRRSMKGSGFLDGVTSSLSGLGNSLQSSTSSWGSSLTSLGDKFKKSVPSLGSSAPSSTTPGVSSVPSLTPSSGGKKRWGGSKKCVEEIFQITHLQLD